MSEPKQHIQWTFAQSLMTTALIANYVAFLLGIQVMMLLSLGPILIGMTILGMGRLAFSYVAALSFGFCFVHFDFNSSRSAPLYRYAVVACLELQQQAVASGNNLDDCIEYLRDYESNYDALNPASDPEFGCPLRDPWGQPFHCLPTGEKPGFHFCSSGRNRNWELGEGDDISAIRPVPQIYKKSSSPYYPLSMSLWGLPMFLFSVISLRSRSFFGL